MPRLQNFGYFLSICFLIIYYVRIQNNVKDNDLFDNNIININVINNINISSTSNKI